MANDIESLKAKLGQAEIGQQLKAFIPQGSGFLSRTLITTMVVIAALVWFGKDNIQIVLWGIIFVALSYIWAQKISDMVKEICDAKTRQILIKTLANPNLSPEQRKEMIDEENSAT